MDFSEFEDLVCNTYKMDIYYPYPIGRNLEDFQTASWQSWAIDELIAHVKNYIYPDLHAPIDDFIEGTANFMRKMIRFEKLPYPNKPAFTIAVNYAEDIIDFLNAMR